MSFIDDLFKKRKGEDTGRKMRGDIKGAKGDIKKLGKKQPKFDMSDFDRQELQGQLEAEELQRSALEDIQLDPRYKQAQLDVLNRYKEGADQGLSDIDLASMRQLRREEDARAAAQQKSVVSDMAQRGAGGSGAELQARLMGTQSQAQNAAEAADRQAIASAQARQQAAANMANQAASMDSTDYQRASNVASAEDSRQKFNLGTRMNVQQQNLGERQRIADSNVGIANQQQQYLNDMRQQKYSNKAGLVDKKMSMNSQMANTRQFKPEEKSSQFDDLLNYGSKGVGIAADIYSMGAKPKVEDGGILYAKDGGCASNYEDGGVEYMSDGSGDIIDSGKESYEGDRVDAKVNDGEMVLNIAQQQRLMDLIKGKESANRIPDEPIVEGVPESYQKELLNPNKNAKMTEGLKKLLSILGE